MIGTTVHNQNTGTEIWQKSHEEKAVSDTWDPKIHCKMIGE